MKIGERVVIERLDGHAADADRSSCVVIRRLGWRCYFYKVCTKGETYHGWNKTLKRVMDDIDICTTHADWEHIK